MDEENALQTYTLRSVADAIHEYARSISYYCNNGWWRVYARLSWFVKLALKTLGELLTEVCYIHSRHNFTIDLQHVKSQ